MLFLKICTSCIYCFICLLFKRGAGLMYYVVFPLVLTQLTVDFHEFTMRTNFN